MQELMTAAIQIVAATFILLMIADFTAGLVATWRNAGAKTPPGQEVAIEGSVVDVLIY